MKRRDHLPVIPGVPVGRQRDSIPVLAYAAPDPTLTIDTPTGPVHIDLIAVERAVNGERAGALTRHEKQLAASLLFDRGISYSVIADRVGVSGTTLRSWFPEQAVTTNDRLARRPRSTHRRSRSEEARCGTRRGYTQHRRRGEPACDRCTAANTLADRHYRLHGTTVGAPEVAA
ncbi:hypothetical protein ACFWWC_03730 [Streptomyces sp. NPDC058642]|uniref:hypothetical protein n=1 Tax=Streptomyces sp. NPDC058642 TaxID=3346572 RepID=UPI0036492012